MKSLGPSLFSGSKGGKVIKFKLNTSNYDADYMVRIPDTDGSDFVALFVPNKTGDNFVLLESSVVPEGGGQVSMQWIADNIKYKTRFNATDETSV